MNQRFVTVLVLCCGLGAYASGCQTSASKPAPAAAPAPAVPAASAPPPTAAASTPTTPTTPATSGATPGASLPPTQPGIQNKSGELPKLKPAKAGAEPEPDLSSETTCEIWHYLPDEKTWEHEHVGWDPKTRLISHMGTVQRFDAKGHVIDFGPGTDALTYDQAGNITQRGGTQSTTTGGYRYRNTYDAKHRLIGVDVATRDPSGKWSTYEAHRSFGYDDKDRINDIGVSPTLHKPIEHGSVEYDDGQRVKTIVWKRGDVPHQRETFGYDSAGHLTEYTRDGLILDGSAAPDGKLDWRQTYRYDARGKVDRMEAFAYANDVVPDAAGQKLKRQDISYYSPVCAVPAQLSSELYDMPYVPLPAGRVAYHVP